MCKHEHYAPHEAAAPGNGAGRDAGFRVLLPPPLPPQPRLSSRATFLPLPPSPPAAQAIPFQAAKLSFSPADACAGFGSIKTRNAFRLNLRGVSSTVARRGGTRRAVPIPHGGQHPRGLSGTSPPPSGNSSRTHQLTCAAGTAGSGLLLCGVFHCKAHAGRWGNETWKSNRRLPCSPQSQPVPGHQFNQIPSSTAGGSLARRLSGYTRHFQSL